MRSITFILILFCVGIKAQKFDLNTPEDSLKSGDIYQFEPDIMYDYDRAVIQKRSISILDSAARYIMNNKSVVFEVAVHLDTRFSNMYSVRLDRKRADAVVKYLINRGVPPEQLIGKGYGEEQPIIPEEEILKMKTNQEKEEAHAVNRRTELRIYRIQKK